MTVNTSALATKRFACSSLFTGAEWRADVDVDVDDAGQIVSISPQGSRVELPTTTIDGAVVPGFQNAHSHAFQYAMAGHAEHLPKGRENDDFWSWRDAMYRLALSISPDQVKAIASLLYAEMVRQGYTAVAEFHYLHRDANGEAYADEALLGRCLVAAAKEAGIRITLVPVWYQLGGFGAPAQPHQKRFISASLDAYLRLLEASQKLVKDVPEASLGMGVHSLRAVAPEDAVLAFANADPALPRHIHIAEQQGEVDAALATLGMRPVQWLLEHMGDTLDKRFHLVHATHIDDQEVFGLANTGAHVVLCPSTEGNLGDGFFPLRAFMEAGGRWSIGTDSHVGLSPHEELRLLDYGQRLRYEKRNILCREGGEDSGMIAFSTAYHAGRAAMGATAGEMFGIGQPFDAIVYDTSHPLLACCPTERRLSTLLYACDTRLMKATIVAGETIVENGKHKRWEAIAASYCREMLE